MEIKFSVARDMQMVMEFLDSKSKEKLNQTWKEHEAFITDEKLRETVGAADEFHNIESARANISAIELSKLAEKLNEMVKQFKI